MIVVLRRGATEAEIAEVEREMADQGLGARRILAGNQPALHVIGGESRRARRLMRLEQVEGLVPTSGPRIRRVGRRFYPYHFVLVAAIWVLLTGALVVLAGFLPPGMGDPIAAHAAPDRIVDPWYARATVEFVSRFRPEFAWLGWVLFLGTCAAVLCLPVIDRGERASGPARIVAILVAVVLALAWAWLTFLGDGA